MSINISTEYMEIEEDSASRRLILEKFEKRRKGRQMPVSVDDNEVKTQLRQLNQPICFFGEGPADRRERLRQLLTELGEEAIKKPKEEEKSQDKEQDTNTTWYHEGPFRLKEARFYIAEYSIKRAKERLEKAREEKAITEAERFINRQKLHKKLLSFDSIYSQVDDVCKRPLTFSQFSPNLSTIATASMSGLCRLWSGETLEPLKTFRGHNDASWSIVFHPQSYSTQSPDALNLASSGAGGAVFLWNLNQETPIHRLEGHGVYRVRRVGFHPSGRFLGTCCGDHSWRLWDLEANEEVLYQEGHSKEVLDISFHPDGSLAATGGEDTFGRVWDLRTGRCIMFMGEHTQSISSICISPNGYQIVTGSADNTVKIWNLRERKCEYTIAAHTDVVSGVMFEKNHGRFLVTSGFDKTIRFWSYPEWTFIHRLKDHDSRIMSVDISSNNQSLVSCSYDKKIKLWNQS